MIFTDVFEFSIPSSIEYSGCDSTIMLEFVNRPNSRDIIWSHIKYNGKRVESFHPSSNVLKTFINFDVMYK